ncbi:PLC-like phosphodiesterase [Paraphaeosphaeria sporulosa]|uniref:PLC-like phosphodiesterase n=1 Tax=Paraphaeosphaeria sporulosa TaxID=1460663 RepID=A0A177CL58_9PLEO|nr:PLC-like phosphodiesterase [Paraphaeosphaeria sporulosa]OAG08284.1 PLC-like phosphodiesterase [Paraphaeosphaeria sporulosa]
MGWGGCVGIMNASPFIWTQTSQSSYQMNSWSFPGSIDPGQLSTTYIEFDQGIFTTETDTSAVVAFQLNNPSSTEIQIHSEVYRPEDLDNPGNVQNIYVQLNNFPSDQNGQRIDLGFNHDQCVTLYLTSATDSLYANSAPVNWMHATLDLIGDKTLRQIALPGAHDAGMGPDFMSGTAFSVADNTKTQATTIGGQLLQGIRWFDIRPVMGDGGQWLSGHYSDGFAGWQGGNGEPISRVISDVNDFLSQNQELVILELSHSINSDDSYRSLNIAEWNALFDMLVGNISHLYTNPVADLSTIPIRDFIGSGPAVVVVARDDDSVLGDYANHGIHPSSSYRVFNKYSESAKPDYVVSDQISKLQNWKTLEPGDNAFLLSWTETESSVNAVPGFGEGNKANAREINVRLFGSLVPVLTKEVFPNIIIEDYVERKDLASLAMGINFRNHAL